MQLDLSNPDPGKTQTENGFNEPVPRSGIKISNPDICRPAIEMLGLLA